MSPADILIIPIALFAWLLQTADPLPPGPGLGPTPGPTPPALRSGRESNLLDRTPSWWYV